MAETPEIEEGPCRLGGGASLIEGFDVRRWLRDPMDAYEELLTRMKGMDLISQIGSLVSWDQEVMMPEGGVNARAMQFSVLSTMRHELIVDERLGELIEEMPREVDKGNESVYREIKDYMNARGWFRRN